MIVTKKMLPRRTVLRGLGVTLALPLLDSMVPALSALSRTAAKPVRRLGFCYVPNGAEMEHWTPTGEGADFAWSPILAPLEPFRDQTLVLSGLAHMQAMAFNDGAGDHSRGTAAWLSGVHARRTEGADVRVGVTADQIAAAELGKQTQLPSLELALETIDLVGNCDSGYSCAYMNTLSWRTPTTPLPVETDPRKVFRRMFGTGGTPEERAARMRRDRSILDSVLEDIPRLRRSIGPSDNARVTEYLDAIRDVEQRIQRTERRNLERPLDFAVPVGTPDTFEEHIALMFDLQLLAYQADITRVITFLIGRELSSRTYPVIGIRDSHHSISHHQNRPEKKQQIAKINTYHIQQLTRFLGKLRSTPDGDGSLLDHTMLAYGSGLSDGNRHDHSPLPILLLGGAAGRVKGGRHIRYANETPMANLLLTMLDKVGVPTDSLGDSTGQLEIDPARRLSNTYLSDV